MFAQTDKPEWITLLACQRPQCPACGLGSQQRREEIARAQRVEKAKESVEWDIIYKGECNHCGDIKPCSQFYPKDWKALVEGHTQYLGKTVSGTDRKAVRPFNHATPRGMCKACYDNAKYWR